MEEALYKVKNNGKKWSVYEVILGSELHLLGDLTEWQAKAICAILNKGK